MTTAITSIAVAVAVLAVANILQGIAIRKLTGVAIKHERDIVDLQIVKLYRDHPATRRRWNNVEDNF